MNPNTPDPYIPVAGGRCFRNGMKEYALYADKERRVCIGGTCHMRSKEQRRAENVWVFAGGLASTNT